MTGHMKYETAVMSKGPWAIFLRAAETCDMTWPAWDISKQNKVVDIEISQNTPKQHNEKNVKNAVKDWYRKLKK